MHYKEPPNILLEDVGNKCFAKGTENARFLSIYWMKIRKTWRIMAALHLEPSSFYSRRGNVNSFKLSIQTQDDTSMFRVVGNIACLLDNAAIDIVNLVLRNVMSVST